MLMDCCVGVPFDFGRDSYTVNEGNGRIILPIIKKGAITETVTITFQTVDGSAGKN